MSKTRKRLERMAEIEQRNEARIGSFIDWEAMMEHKRSRLAYIEGYTREKAGYEGVRDQIISRYRSELDLED